MILESIAALAELDSVIPCRELVGRIVSWLINLPFLSMRAIRLLWTYEISLLLQICMGELEF